MGPGIGRLCPFASVSAPARGQSPLSNRACGFPAHGLPVVARVAALRGLLPGGLPRVADGPAQAMKAEIPEVLARPALRLTRLQAPSRALHAKAEKSSPDVFVELVEALSGVPGAEVVPPTPEYGVQVSNDVADIRVAP